MRRLFLLLAASLLSIPAFSQKPLQFRADSTFKIMQLTDLHMISKYPEEYQKVLSRIDKMAALEKPDFIAITGDMIYRKPAGEQIRDLVAHLDALNIPWAVVFGNHDAEQDLTRPELSALYVSGKNSLNTLNKKKELADIEIPILLDGKPMWYIYMMDSNDYSSDRSIGKYGAFTFDQVNWMREKCAARVDKNGNVAPSFAFFHIPLCEYVDAWAPMADAHEGAGDSKRCIGMLGENVAHGALNTGMFAAMKESGSILATFVGHDHDNDYVACYKGIALCYGRYSGCNTVYNNIPAGARFISIKAGERAFTTWIRDDSGRILRRTKTDGRTLSNFPSRAKGTRLVGIFD